jgi:hypothetical protein
MTYICEFFIIINCCYFSGYLHIKQDVQDLISLINKARQEWNENFNSTATIHIDSINVIEEKVKHLSWSDSNKTISTKIEKTDDGQISSPLEKLKIKIVLMGSNMIIHRFLAAYIAICTDKEYSILDVNLEVYIVPQGKNYLGLYLARADKWYRRHIFDSFKGSLGICPLYSNAREYGQYELDGLNMEVCIVLLLCLYVL